MSEYRPNNHDETDEERRRRLERARRRREYQRQKQKSTPKTQKNEAPQTTPNAENSREKRENEPTTRRERFRKAVSKLLFGARPEQMQPRGNETVEKPTWSQRVRKLGSRVMTMVTGVSAEARAAARQEAAEKQQQEKEAPADQAEQRVKQATEQLSRVAKKVEAAPARSSDSNSSEKSKKPETSAKKAIKIAPLTPTTVETSTATAAPERDTQSDYDPQALTLQEGTAQKHRHEAARRTTEAKSEKQAVPRTAQEQFLQMRNIAVLAGGAALLLGVKLHNRNKEVSKQQEEIASLKNRLKKQESTQLKATGQATYSTQQSAGERPPVAQVVREMQQSAQKIEQAAMRLHTERPTVTVERSSLRQAASEKVVKQNGTSERSGSKFPEAIAAAVAAGMVIEKAKGTPQKEAAPQAKQAERQPSTPQQTEHTPRSSKNEQLSSKTSSKEKETAKLVQERQKMPFFANESQNGAKNNEKLEQHESTGQTVEGLEVLDVVDDNEMTEQKYSKRVEARDRDGAVGQADADDNKGGTAGAYSSGAATVLMANQKALKDKSTQQIKIRRRQKKQGYSFVVVSTIAALIAAVVLF